MQNMLDKCYVKSDKVVFRKIADEFVLVPIHKEAVDLESIFSFNETAARMWELMDGKKTGFEIAKTVAEEFKQETGEVEKDLMEFIAKLKKLNFVLEAQL